MRARPARRRPAGPGVPVATARCAPRAAQRRAPVPPIPATPGPATGATIPAINAARARPKARAVPTTGTPARRISARPGSAPTPISRRGRVAASECSVTAAEAASPPALSAGRGMRPGRETRRIHARAASHLYRPRAGRAPAKPWAVTPRRSFVIEACAPSAAGSTASSTPPGRRTQRTPVKIATPPEAPGGPPGQISPMARTAITIIYVMVATPVRRAYARRRRRPSHARAHPRAMCLPGQRAIPRLAPAPT